MTDPDQVRFDLEATRQDLQRDAEALVDHIHPVRAAKRRARRWSDRLGDGISAVRERVMGAADGPADRVARAGDAAAEVAGHAADRVARAGDAAAEVAGHAADRVARAGDAAAEVAGHARVEVRRQTDGHPLTAGLVAFGIGWALAGLLPPTERERALGRRAADLAADQVEPAREQAVKLGKSAASDLAGPALQAAGAVKDAAVNGNGSTSGDNS